MDREVSYLTLIIVFRNAVHSEAFGKETWIDTYIYIYISFIDLPEHITSTPLLDVIITLIIIFCNYFFLLGLRKQTYDGFQSIFFFYQILGG